LVEDLALLAQLMKFVVAIEKFLAQGHVDMQSISCSLWCYRY
jgi:hypothetical protein